MTWSWEAAADAMPFLLDGARITVEASLTAFVFALIVGLALALFRQARSRPVRTLSSGIIQLIRRTPLLVQLYFWFFVLPDFGIRASPLITGIIGLGLHLSSYTAEVYRAGIDDIPKGIVEATEALHFRGLAAWRHVYIPVAVPAIVPALGNYLVASFKYAPILATISVLDVLGQAQLYGGRTFRYLEAMTLTGLIYFILSYASALVVNYVAQRTALRGTLG